jgi:hypothetical protein
MAASSQDLILLGVGGAVLLVVVLCVVFLHFWNERSEAIRDVRRQFKGADITMLSPQAYFRGFDRSWDGQWRGYGVLVLTEEVLYFRPWSRHLDITVPVGRIGKVMANGDLGRKGFLHLHHHLQVSYVGMDDQVRVATWSVENPREWASDLVAVRGRKVVS